MFNCSMELFISKYLLFIGYIQNVLTVNFHSIFTIISFSQEKPWPVVYDQRGGQSVNILRTGDVSSHPMKM